MQFKPSEYQHRILYAVLGLSPQILTETLYALLHADEPFIPTEIHVLTTTRGEQHCRLALFKENGGWFHKFCQDFNLSGIQFSENHIHVLESETGEQLEDIRTPQENNDVANQITRQIKNFT
jgi:CRISPR-associated protein (TIGR02584 family)